MRCSFSVVMARPGGACRKRQFFVDIADLPGRAARMSSGNDALRPRAVNPLSATAIVVVTTLAPLYIVSQFLRNSVGVIAPNLAAEMRLSPIELGLLSSIYFFAFAAPQIPL